MTNQYPVVTVETGNWHKEEPHAGLAFPVPSLIPSQPCSTRAALETTEPAKSTEAAIISGI